MLQYVGDNAAQFKTDYGNVSPASIGAIQRGIARARAPGGRQVLRRADARGRRSDADRLEGPRRRQRPRRGQADAVAEALLDLSPVAARRALREPAGGRRPRAAEARLLLRRGASALQRRAEGAAREGGAGGAADPLQGRGRVLLQPEPARHPGNRARSARQPRPARAPRLHAEGPEGGQDGGADAAREPEARHREGDHGARRRRGARVASRREGHPGRRRARLHHAARLEDRPDPARRTKKADRRLGDRRALRAGDRPRVGVREAERAYRRQAVRCARDGERQEAPPPRPARRPGAAPAAC